MARISMSVNKLKQFIELVSCEGETEEGGKAGKVITEFVISAFDSYIETFGIDKVGKLFAHVKMSATVIEPGPFNVGNVGIFESYLSVFENKDIITLTQESGMIKIERASPRKLAKFPTVSTENIETHKTAELINSKWKFNAEKTEISTESTTLNNIIVAKAEDFAQVVKDSKVVGEQHYPFVVTKDETGQMMLKVDVGSLQTSMGVIKSMIPAVVKSVELNNKYAYGFDNVFTTLSGEVKLFVAPDMPLWVVKDESDYSVRYMLTPVVG